MLEKFRVLPLEKQQEAVKLVEALGRESAPPRIKLFLEIDEIVSAVPLEEWAELQADSAANIDHSVAVQNEASAKPIWEIIEELSAQVPEEDWRSVPADGAEQHDHYLYGAPKR